VAEDTDLLAELEGDQRNAGGRCNTGNLLAMMTETARAEWDKAIANPKYTGASIHRAAERRGITFGEQSLLRHIRRVRRGTGCQCPIPNR
jgi:hypothetical protein